MRAFLYSLTTRASSDILLRTSALPYMECTNAERWAFAIDACKGIIEDAMQWLRDDPEEPVRPSLWLLQADGAVGFVVGNIDEAQRLIFSEDSFTIDDDDYIGRAWRDQRVVNEADAPEEWRGYNGGPDEPYFHGVMFVPVRWRGKPWALLEVDRRQAQRFSRDAEVVAAAAANPMGLLLADYTARRSWAVPTSTARRSAAFLRRR